MRVVVATAHGAPDVLEIQERPPSNPSAGEVRVDVHAAGVNFMDTYLRRGMLQVIPPPFVPGVDGAGVVTAVGEGVDAQVGDRVAWERVMGSYAEELIVPADRLVPVPDTVALQTAAAGLMQALTAHHLCHAAVDTGNGDVALVHSAASGVGRMLTQIITRRGGRVIATVSKQGKVPIAQAAGASDVLVRDQQVDLAAEVRRLTKGRGVDVVFDGTGADSYRASIDATRYGGTFVHFGQAGGPIPPLDLWEQPDGVKLMRSRGDAIGATPEQTLARACEVFSWIADGTLDVLIGQTYSLAEASRAHADIESQSTVGKLLLLPG